LSCMLYGSIDMNAVSMCNAQHPLNAPRSRSADDACMLERTWPLP